MMARPILTLDDAAHEHDQADGEPDHDGAHLDGDELLGPHRTGEAGLQQVGVDTVDVLRRVQARQSVAQATHRGAEDPAHERRLHPIGQLHRLGVDLGLGPERANEVEAV